MQADAVRPAVGERRRLLAAFLDPVEAGQPNSASTVRLPGPAFGLAQDCTAGTSASAFAWRRDTR